MKLAWKAAALILINVVITFAAGLLARNFILNPEFAQVERSNDEKVLRQLNLIQELVVASLVDSVNRARQTASGIREDHWQQYSVAISSLAANSDYDFIISASRNGDFAQVRPGRTFNRGVAPSSEEVERIIARARNAESYPYVDILALDEGPAVLAAQQFLHPDGKGPELFIVASQINDAFTQRLSAFAGVDLRLTSFEEHALITQEPRALSGIRSESNTMHWAVNDARGIPAVTFSVELPPRSYDDKILTPTLAIALLFTLLMWSVAIWLLYRTLIWPMKIGRASCRERV